MNPIETGKYIVHLIISLLNDQKPMEKPEHIAFKDIYRMSVKHNVCVMTLNAVDRLSVKPDDDLYKEWDQRRNVSIAQGILQLNERDQLFKKLEESHIQYLPLKGCLLKEMYPKPEFREMSDLDILIKPESQENVKELMESSGYITENFGIKKDDSYRKPPFVHVEMHHMLLEDVIISQMNITDSFLLDPFSYAHQINNSGRFELSPEDMYIYLTVHNAKHYIRKGTGIRQFIDFIVFERTVDIDQNYVNKRLDDIGLAWFKRDTDQLLKCWKDGTAVPAELEEMQNTVFSSGSYGSAESKVRINMKNASDTELSEAGYLRYRFFPPYRIMKASYPVLRKQPWLLPAVWLYRIAFKGFPKTKRHLRELRLFKSIQKHSDD